MESEAGDGSLVENKTKQNTLFLFYYKLIITAINFGRNDTAKFYVNK